MSRVSRWAAIAAVLVLAAQLTFGSAAFPVPTASAQAAPCTSLRTLPGLQSITIYEVTRHTFGDPYVFGPNDPRLTQDINELTAGPGTLDLYTEVALENYDFLYSNVDGTFNPDGQYLTIQAYRNLAGALYADAANNIDAVMLTFANGQKYYVDAVASSRLGTNPYYGGRLNDALGAPNVSAGRPLHTALGNGSTSLTVAFSGAFAAAQSSGGCGGSSSSVPPAAPCTSIRTLPGLQSITIYEVSSHITADPYPFNVNDPRLTQDIDEISASQGTLDLYTPGPKENYDFFYGNADGTFNPDGRYIVIQAYRNLAGATYADAANNIDSVLLTFANGQKYYVDTVGGYRLGTNPRGGGYVNSVVGAPDTYFNEGHFTRLGNGSTYIAVGFNNAFAAVLASGACQPASSSSSSAPRPQCSDGVDNADPEDALADNNDPGCYTNGFYDPNDNNETDQFQCSDGVDNADPEDTLADWNDPGCYNGGIYTPTDNDETNAAASSAPASSAPASSSASSALPQCRDGMDNDGDGAIDFPSDFSCSGPDDNDETNPKAQCQDGVDNADSEDTLADSQDPGCHYDGNPNNPNSYNPQDNDEFNAVSSSSVSSAPFVPQCRDNIDNDGDGAIDYPSDFSCSGSEDNDETLPKAQCQDGQDNDGDGKVDFPADPGCVSLQDNDEFNAASSASSQIPQCRNGMDDDGDGAIDYPSDFSCSGPDDNDETNPKAQCQDGADNDGDGKVDSQDPGCHYDGNPGNLNSYNPQDNDEFNLVISSSASSALPQCRDNVDNDGDGAIDYPSDFSCSGPDDNDETNPKAQCQDGYDNDGDAKADAQDPGCHYDGNPNNPNSYNPQDNDEFNVASSAPFVPQCRDNVDNDGDGAIDYPSDFSCSGSEDNDETLPKAQCQDGIDNDGDGKVDFPADPGCVSLQDNDEFNAASSASSQVPQCRNGMDDDGDGAIDYPSDFSCSGPDDNDETNPKAQCQDNADNDGDGKVDSQDPGCHWDGNPGNSNSYNPQDNDEFNAVSSSSAPFTPQCRDGIDNDGDGAVDYPSDFSCSGPDDNDETLPRTQCQDGSDNDGDSLVDANDPGCHYDGNAGNPNSYNKQDNDEFNAASSSSAASSVSSAPSAGCILVLNETFDTQGNPIYQAAAQFTYTLDGNQTAVNNASGIARFDGVAPGNHLVGQQGNGAWTNLSITPAGGNVQVAGGPICAAVIFKNKQNSIGGQSSSVYNPYPYYQPDPYAYGNSKNETMCRSLADKYGDRYANAKKKKKLPKAIRKLMDDCDDDFGNAAWWLN